MKAYTDLEQSKKLVEIMPLETVDMCFNTHNNMPPLMTPYSKFKEFFNMEPTPAFLIPCWSLAALLKYLSEIKPQVYTPVLFPSEGKWILQFVEYGHGNVCEMSCDNPVDACVEIVTKLYELKML